MARLLSLLLLLLALPAPAQPVATPPPSDAVLPPRDAARDIALQAIEVHLACGRYDHGDLQLDLEQGSQAATCPGPFATQLRSDLERSLAALTTAQLADKRLVAEAVERKFVPLRPEYERAFRYPRAQLDWFMKNVRCVCEGCKPTIFFAKCGLSCATGIVYKLRAKVFLAFGFSTDELLAYYLADVNAQRPPREQIDHDYLLPGTQREKGWLVPALALGGVGLLLLWLLRRWAKRKPPQPDVAAPPQPQVSDAARRKVAAALDDDPQW